MERKYSIGFFALLSGAVLVLTLAYQTSYRRAYEKVEQMEAQLEKADGDARKESGYCLVERNGYIVVCLADGVTFYADTDIRIDRLPRALAREIADGKYIETEKALYGFLENYSS